MSADTWTLSSYLASEIIPLLIHSLELITDFFLYSLLKSKHPWKELALRVKDPLMWLGLLNGSALWGELWDTIRAVGILEGGAWEPNPGLLWRLGERVKVEESAKG